jgi:hypothetical protein
VAAIATKGLTLSHLSPGSPLRLFILARQELTPQQQSSRSKASVARYAALLGPIDFGSYYHLPMNGVANARKNGRANISAAATTTAWVVR